MLRMSILSISRAHRFGIRGSLGSFRSKAGLKQFRGIQTNETDGLNVEEHFGGLSLEERRILKSGFTGLLRLVSTCLSRTEVNWNPPTARACLHALTHLNE